MKGMFVSGVLLGLLWPACSFAGPLQTEHVAADARWLVHVDVNAIQSSESLHSVFEKRISEHPLVRSLEDGRWKINVDFQGGVRGITLYGREQSQTRGVLLLYTKRGDVGSSSQIPDLPGQKTISYHGHSLYTWSWAKDQPAAVALALPLNDLAVWAGSVKSLKSALDVIDGRNSNLDSQETLMDTDAPPGSMFLVRADNPASIGDSGAAKLIGHVRSFAYAEGVQRGRWFGRLAATTDTPEVNQHLKSVIDGAISAYWLLYGGRMEDSKADDESTDLKVSVVKNRVEVQLHAPLKELAQTFGSFWQWTDEEPEPSPKAESRGSKNKKGRNTSAM